MSYDVTVHDVLGAEVLDVNHTCNTSGIWRDRGVDLRDWSGGSADDLAAALRPLVADLVQDPEAFRHYDHPGGWGTVETTTRFLFAILDACAAAPRGRVEVWA